VSTREEILFELGITPRWKRRDVGKIESSEEGSSSGDLHKGAISSNASGDWSALKTTIESCDRCKLCESRKKVVVGVGDPAANWLFIGEGPGAEEDERGEPFVGRAGQLLDNMLLAMRLNRRENVYIANVVKCRPPGNRNPEPIDLIAPQLIVLLGKVAAHRVIGGDGTLASYRGVEHRYKNISTVVTYHPAYLLRNQLDKAKAWKDLCFAMDLMDKKIEQRK
jgi:uracil-DNA glycosylase family 4